MPNNVPQTPTMRCTHFGTCGGCSLPGVAYDEQLRRKRRWLEQLLGLDVPPLIASPRHTGFRQKAAFVFGSGPRGLLMGHYAARSKRVVPVEECPVHSPRANRIAFELRDQLGRARVQAADRPGGLLRHVIVRTTENDEEAIAMLVVTRNDRALRAPIRRLLASPLRPDGFLLNVNPRPGPFMVGGDTIQIDGRRHARQRDLAGVDFLSTADAFFQTNVGAARQLVGLVVDEIGEARRVIDLYCGSGLFTLPLARRGARVTAIEENRQAIADLNANLRLNRIDSGSVRALAARVEDALERIGRERWDAVVLDPPREGCSAAVLEAVFERIRPGRVVYVSCNPEALARELRDIGARGYRVQRIQPLDMFPHTDHVETVVTLRPFAGSFTA